MHGNTKHEPILSTMMGTADLRRIVCAQNT